MKILTLAILIIAAMNPPSPAQTLPLWPNAAPGALGSKDEDIPALTAYLSTDGNSNGASFLDLPDRKREQLLMRLHKMEGNWPGNGEKASSPSSQSKR